MVAAAFQVVLPKGLEWACVGIALGSVGGEALAFCYTFTLYLRDRRKRMKNAGKGKGEKVASDVLSIAVPVALSSYLKSALVTLENILIPAGFRKYGADTAQALAQYGMMEAMVMPVLSFPGGVDYLIFLAAGAGGRRMAGNRQESEIDRLTEQTLRGTFLFSLPVATAFILFGEQLGSSIYGNAEAGQMLWVMAPLTPIPLSGYCRGCTAQRDGPATFGAAVFDYRLVPQRLIIIHAAADIRAERVHHRFILHQLCQCSAVDFTADGGHADTFQ